LIEEDHEELALAQKQKLMNTVSRHKVEVGSSHREDETVLSLTADSRDQHEKNPTPPGYW